MYAIKRPNRILMACLAAFMLSSAATTLAASSGPGDFPFVIVRYSELDLSRGAGASVLYKRIQTAAAKVCSHSVIPFTIPNLKRSSCYRNAIEKAVAQVNNAQLYAIHRARGPRLARVD
jgi:UrcA family protein